KDLAGFETVNASRGNATWRAAALNVSYRGGTRRGHRAAEWRSNRDCPPACGLPTARRVPGATSAGPDIGCVNSDVHDVLIAGAGPVGLMLAGELQRRGIDHVLIERRPEPEYFCKALGVTPRTLEVCDQIGVLEDVLRRGLFTAGVSGETDGKDPITERVELGTMPYGFLLLAQYDTERVLRRHLQRHGGRVEPGVVLTGIEVDADGVRARVLVGEREQTIACRYVVGCDGAHSVVRKDMGVDYEGDAYPM